MKRYESIKNFFEYWLKDIKFDKELYLKLRNFRLAWSTKNDEYIDFLGSHLLGVHDISFSSIDDDNLMSIFEIDDIDTLQKDFYKVKGIIKSHKVASNVIYHILTYTTHKFLTNKKLKEKERITFASEPCLIMQYKMFTSIYNHYFRYRVNESVAETVYNKLTYKYIIKQVNSWQETFTRRALDCISPKGPNYKRLIRYTTEDAIRVVIDIQTKIRSSIKTIYTVLIKVLEEGDIIQSDQTTFVGGEKEEKQIKDIETGQHRYINNILHVAYSPNDFIDMNGVKIVDNMVSNVNSDLIVKFLKCMSNKEFIEEYGNKFKKILGDDIKDPHTEVLKKILLIDIEYLQRYDINISDKSKLPKMIVMIKNYWSSSKVNNEDMKKIKSFLSNMAVMCTKKKTKWLITSLVIAYVTYIFLRSMKLSQE